MRCKACHGPTPHGVRGSWCQSCLGSLISFLPCIRESEAACIKDFHYVSDDLSDTIIPETFPGEAWPIVGFVEDAYDSAGVPPIGMSQAEDMSPCGDHVLTFLSSVVEDTRH